MSAVGGKPSRRLRRLHDPLTRQEMLCNQITYNKDQYKNDKANLERQRQSPRDTTLLWGK